MLSLNIKRQINKPEYWLRPSQICRRIKYKKSHSSEVPIDIDGSGKNFYVNPNETIGHSLLTMGVYDLVVAEAIYRILKRNDLFCDVGANIGYFTRLALKIGARVKSFEPHPIVFQKLTKNLNDDSLCETYPLALSNTVSETDLFIPNEFNNNEGVASLEHHQEAKKIKVKTTLIDEILASEESITLMKIDIEGHEEFAFKGAHHFLKSKALNSIIFEDFTAPHSKTIMLLEKYDYKVMRLQKELLGPKLIPWKETSSINAWEPVNYIAFHNSEFIQPLFKDKGWKVFSSLP